MLEFAAGKVSKQETPAYSINDRQGYAGKAALRASYNQHPDLGDLPTDSLFAPDLDREKFANYYAVPLIAKGQVKGVLEIYHRSLLQPDDDWLDFLATIAGQTAVAIDSACMFQDSSGPMRVEPGYDAAIESWHRCLN